VLVPAVAIGIAAACGPGSHRHASAPARPAGPWTWVASSGGPWRLPSYGFDVAIAADDTHAVIRTGSHEAVVLDLTTGAVGPTTVLVTAPSSIDSIVRVGDRLLAFGITDAGAAVWAITTSPLAATALDAPADPHPAKPKRTSSAIAVSPDGTRVFVCGATRWPVLRDASTLAVIRTYDDLATCREPYFADAGHILIRTATPQLVELATGTTTALQPRGPYALAGPGGRVLTVSEYSRWRFTDAAGALLGEARGYGTPRWLPDGSGVVAVALGQVTVQPAGGGEARKVSLPSGDNVSRFAVSMSGTAVLLIGHVIIAVDLVAGTTRTADGNIGSVDQVAARGDAVIAATNRIRAWRDGRLVANGEPGVTSFDARPASAPVVTLSASSVSSWDPTTGDRRVIRELEDIGTLVRRGGDQLVFDDGYSVFRGVRGRPPTRWFRFRDDLSLAALDVASGRVAWSGGDAYHVADIDRGQVWSFCASGDRIAFDPARPRVGVDDLDQIQLYDLAGRRALGGVGFDDLMIGPWAFVPTTGELVMASDGEVVLWDPAKQTVISWLTGDAIEPSAIDVDATGTRLAIGYADGGIRWATLAGVRVHAHPRAFVGHPPAALDCAEHPVAQVTLDEIIVAGGDDDGDPGELDCNDSNDDPEDDCAVIYGAPE